MLLVFSAFSLRCSRASACKFNVVSPPKINVFFCLTDQCRWWVMLLMLVHEQARKATQLI